MAEALWDGVAQAYVRSFEGLCAGTVPTMLEGITAGSRVLDVGCGAGSLMAAASARGIDVRGVEPDLEMAALARARDVGTIVKGGLPDLPLEDRSFDVVLANFVLNHVDNPRWGVRELARVAAPGGTVRATIWPGFPQPQSRLWGDVLERAGAVLPELPRLSEHLDFERSTDGLAEIFTEAGFPMARAQTLSWEWTIDPADLLAGMTTVGNFGVTWRAQGPVVQQRIAEAYAALTEPLMVDGTLRFRVGCVLVEAVAP